MMDRRTLLAAAAAMPVVPALAADDARWAGIAAQYDVTRKVVQLEHGNWGMMARPVLAAYRAHVDRVNRDTSFYARREMPGEIARLHLAASGWYESQQRPVPAIDHAIEGGDHPHALTLLDSYAGRFLEQGRMRMLARWFSAIPEHQLREHPALQPIALWATCFTNGTWQAMQP